MTEFELDIPSLTSEGIQLTYNAFGEVKELLCSSMIEWIANDWDADSLEYYIRQKSKYLWYKRNTGVFISNEHKDEICC